MEHGGTTSALPRARIERPLSRRDIRCGRRHCGGYCMRPTLASEIVAINAEDLDLEQRRAPFRSKGGDNCSSVRRRVAIEPERPDLERDNHGWHPPDARP